MAKRAKPKARAKPKPKRKSGRPSTYSLALVTALCQHLSGGDSMRKACARPGMPVRETVTKWLLEHEDFARMYATAIELQIANWADEIRDTAEGPGVKVDTAIRVRRDRLRMDALKWLLAKLKPKQYGDRLHLDANVTRSVESLSDAELEAIAAGAGGDGAAQAAEGSPGSDSLH